MSPQFLVPEDGQPWRGLPPVGSPEFIELVDVIQTGLPELSPTQAAVALGVWGGLTEAELADWLKRSVATVHQHFRAAIRRLPSREVAKPRRADLILAVERVLARHDGGEGQALEADPLI